MTLIKIDRSTVRSNPNAGRQDYWELASQIVTFTFPWSSPELPRVFEKSAKLTTITPTGEEWILTAIIRDTLENFGHLLRVLGVEENRIHYDIQNNYREGHSLVPEPAHFFAYIPTEVSCGDCGSSFPHTELKSRVEDTWDGEEIYSCRVCPKCAALDCCDLEFEPF